MRYDNEMETTTETTTVDLTGLPEPVIASIKQLVTSLRNGNTSSAEKKAEPPLLRGRFSQDGASFTKEDFDEAQREMWANFPRDFPELPSS